MSQALNVRPTSITGQHQPLRWLPALALLLALLAQVLPAVAAVPPPGRVGRLVEAPAGVWLQDRDSGRWMASAEQSLVNWPLTSGDRLRTDSQARAEWRVGSLTVRLDGRSELLIQRLDDQHVVLRLEQGSAALKLADKQWTGQVELLTREGRWLPQRAGHFRFDREPDATQASVWRGELRFESADSTLLIAEGRRADLWLPPGGAATHFAWAAVANDAFSDWVARDERADAPSRSDRYVSPEMTGWQDLDRYGDWQDHPEHGGVWLPRQVAPGWEPYRDGRWAWVAPWGWTWVDAAPWGFAPFHYGLWLQVGGRWAWSPGARQHRPVFAPVLGGWVRGPQLNIGVTIGGGHTHRPPPPVVVVPRASPGPGRGDGHGRGRGHGQADDHRLAPVAPVAPRPVAVAPASPAPVVMARPGPPRHDDADPAEQHQVQAPPRTQQPLPPPSGQRGRGAQRDAEGDQPTMSLPRRPGGPPRLAEPGSPSRPSAAAPAPLAAPAAVATPVAAPQPAAPRAAEAEAAGPGPRGGGRPGRADRPERPERQERPERADAPERAQTAERREVQGGGRGGREPRQQN